MPHAYTWVIQHLLRRQVEEQQAAELELKRKQREEKYAEQKASQVH